MKQVVRTNSHARNCTLYVQSGKILLSVCSWGQVPSEGLPGTWDETHRLGCAVTDSPGRGDLPQVAVAKANTTLYLSPGHHSLSGFCHGPVLWIQGAEVLQPHEPFEGVSGQTGDKAWQIPMFSHGIIETSISHSREEAAACSCRQRCLGGVGVDSKDSSSEAAYVTSAVRELPVTPLPCCCHTPFCRPPQRRGFWRRPRSA